MAERDPIGEIAATLPEDEQQAFRRIAQAYGTSRPEMIPQVAKLFERGREESEEGKQARVRLHKLQSAARLILSHDNARKAARADESGRAVRPRVAQAVLDSREIPGEVLAKHPGMREMARFDMGALLHHTARPHSGRDLSATPLAEMDEAEVRALAEMEVLSILTSVDQEAMEAKLSERGETLEGWVAMRAREREEALGKVRQLAQAKEPEPEHAPPASTAKAEAPVREAAREEGPALPPTEAARPSPAAAKPRTDRPSLYPWQQTIYEEIIAAFPEDVELRECVLDYLEAGRVENARGVEAIEKVLRLRDVARFLVSERTGGTLDDETRAERARLAKAVLEGEDVSREALSAVNGMNEMQKFDIRNILAYYASGDSLEVEPGTRLDEIEAEMIDRAVDAGAVRWYRALLHGPEGHGPQAFGGDAQEWMQKKRREYRGTIRAMLADLDARRPSAEAEGVYETLPEASAPPAPEKHRAATGKTERRTLEAFREEERKLREAQQSAAEEQATPELDSPEENLPTLFDMADEAPKPRRSS